MKFIKDFILNMFSEGSSTSCLRFVITLIIVTMMFNWTYFNIANDQLASLDLKDIATILGLLVIKIGQKKIEVGK